MKKDTIATEIRRDILRMMQYSKSSHIGSCLSIVELLSVLYFKVMNIDPVNPAKADRDIFILSKGHASAALYATLALRGFFPREWLNHYYVDGGRLPGHLDMTAAPGIECSTGSLGHGLSVGLGMSIARKRRNLAGGVFVLLGDGECNEGSVWEAVMLAGTLRQGNLTVIVDQNHIQSMGADVIEQANLADRFSAFGWSAVTIDGHDTVAIEKALRTAHEGPLAVIANTIKGKGISFMEGRLEWHYKSPSPSEYEAALKELDEDNAD